MKKLLLFIILFTTNSCILLGAFGIGIKGYWLDEGGYRPKNPDFKLGNNEFIWNHNTDLDTSALYSYINIPKNSEYQEYDSVKTDFLKRYKVPKHMFLEQPIDTTFHFFRFMGNGKVYHFQSNKRIPSIEEQNNFTKGVIGYYMFVDDKSLIIELFMPINFGQYETYQSKILGDTLFFHKINYTKYVKNDEKGIFLYSVPNW